MRYVFAVMVGGTMITGAFIFGALVGFCIADYARLIKKTKEGEE